jgi:putative copper export protein
MNSVDYIILAMKWMHNLSAFIWVGGSLFFVFVLKPLKKTNEIDESVSRNIFAEFKSIANGAIGVLIITGIILTVSQLTFQKVPSYYVYILMFKILLAIIMFGVAGNFRKRLNRPRSSKIRIYKYDMDKATVVVILGVIVIGMSDILESIMRTN